MGKLSVPLERDLHRRLRMRAFDEDRPMAELVREALERFLDPAFVASYVEPAPEGPQRRVESRSTGPDPEPPPGRPSSAQGRVLGGKPGCDHKDKKVVAGIRICADDACRAVIRR